jgi:glutamine synthetase adenylyltransferase
MKKLSTLGLESIIELTSCELNSNSDLDLIFTQIEEAYNNGRYITNIANHLTSNGFPFPVEIQDNWFN